MKFPVDAPQRRVLAAMELLGFNLVRTGIISHWPDEIPTEQSLP